MVTTAHGHDCSWSPPKTWNSVSDSSGSRGLSGGGLGYDLLAMAVSSSSNSPTRYSGAAQALHWATAVLVLVAFIYGPGGSESHVYSSAKDFDRRLHETLGLAVLVLSAVRLFWRALDRHPDPPEVPRWMGLTSKAVQGLLYLLLFVVPITAIAGAWLEGHAVTWLGGSIGPWLAESHDLGTKIATLHGWLGDVILWTAGLHAAAALFHHFVLRDGVLRSMLPGRLGSPS
jgi:cytochrome b561